MTLREALAGIPMRRWALTEGFVHEAFLEVWLREFFGQ